MDAKDIKDLMQAFSASCVTQLHYKKDGTELLLDKGSVKTEPQALQPTVVEVCESVQQVQVAQVTTSAPIKAPASTQATPITAPLVGVYYTSAGPDSPPFVKQGQSVKKGDTLCIIEAMKVLNEIKAPNDGIVQNILAENGVLVEFGQTLMELADV